MKIRIRLVYRKGDSEIYELAMPGAISKYRAHVSGAAIASGNRWRELAAQFAAYQYGLQRQSAIKGAA